MVNDFLLVPICLGILHREDPASKNETELLRKQFKAVHKLELGNQTISQGAQQTGPNRYFWFGSDNVPLQI
ncbi:MAG: hypothetical protein D3910_15160 [Candidatus Electrothrix sp. ATG2]|nr:hypothetical protein [Candidatus Electrothrix sp. ATG2]